jgi:hypothetical protein
MTSPNFSPVRRAACAVTVGPARATGWLVSQRGLFVTSHSAVGYQVDVDVHNDAGDDRPGRVVWVDVARDVALVLVDGALPRAPEPMSPLAIRDVPAPRSGDRVYTVAALPGRGLRIAPASICVAPRAGGPDLIDIDADLIGPLGGPLLDHDCRAVGLLVRAPQGRAPFEAVSREARRSSVLPAAEIRGALRAIDAALDLPRRAPVYRCPACVTPFVPEHDACLACGAPLPHPFPPSAAHPLAERTIREALAMAGVIANRARTGPRSWHLATRGAPGGEPVPVTLTLDDTWTTAALRAPVALAPSGPAEPFYRLLLTLNDQTTGPFRLALAGDRVVVMLVLPVAMLQGRDLPPTLVALGEIAEHFRKILQEGFDCPPLTSLDAPPAW